MLNKFGISRSLLPRIAAQAYLSEPASSVITTIGEFVSVPNPFVISDLSIGMVMNGTNELIYTGNVPMFAVFNAAFSVNPSNNDLLAFRATKNGVTLDYSETIVQQGAGPGSSPRVGAVIALLELAPDDHVGLAVADLGGTNNVPWLTATYLIMAA